MDTIIMPSENPIWQIVAKSYRGPRAENQDNYLVINADGQFEHLLNEKIVTGHLEHWPKGCIRLAVADGMGGHNNGRQASEALILALLKLEFQTKPEKLRKEIIKLHNILFEQFHQGAKTPGSTLVMADISNKGLVTIINVGDSRAYLQHNGIWKQLTKDHTPLEFAYRDGEITEDSYDKGLQVCTNRIVQAIGFGSSGIIPNEDGIKTNQHLKSLRIEISQNDAMICQIKANDVLMLASDGVWSGREANYIPTKLSNNETLKAYREQLLNAADKRTQDNVTLVLCSQYQESL